MLKMRSALKLSIDLQNQLRPGAVRGMCWFLPLWTEALAAATVAAKQPVFWDF